MVLRPLLVHCAYGNPHIHTSASVIQLLSQHQRSVLWSVRKGDKLQRPTATCYAEVRVLGRLRPEWLSPSKPLAQGTLLRQTPSKQALEMKWTHREWSGMPRSCMGCTWPVYILAPVLVLVGFFKWNFWISKGVGLWLLLVPFPALFSLFVWSQFVSQC